MTGRIYLSSPDVTEAEESAVVRAIRSGWIAPILRRSHGPRAQG